MRNKIIDIMKSFLNESLNNQNYIDKLSKIFTGKKFRFVEKEKFDLTDELPPNEVTYKVDHFSNEDGKIYVYVTTLNIHGFNSTYASKYAFNDLKFQIEKYINVDVGFETDNKIHDGKYKALLFIDDQKESNEQIINPNAKPSYFEGTPYQAIIPTDIDLKKFVDEHPNLYVLKIVGNDYLDLSPLAKLDLEILSLTNAPKLHGKIPTALAKKVHDGSLFIVYPKK